MSREKEKTLKDVLADLWAARIFIAVAAFFGFVIAALWVYSATPYYKASIVVSPANPMNGAEISSLLADDNLFALRYLVQRVGVANSSDFLHFENTYAGPSVAAKLLHDDNIKSGLSRDRTFSFSEAEESRQPEELSAYLQERIKLEPVGGTTLRRLVYLHPDRRFASYFIARVHEITDRIIRTNINREAGERIRCLSDAIASTNNPEHRRALTTLLLEQERLRMLVSIEQPYAAAVVEPASASVKPVWPDPALLFTAFGLGFAFFGFVVHRVTRPQDSIEALRRRTWREVAAEDQNNRERPFRRSA